MRTRLTNCEILDPTTGKRFWGFVDWEGDRLVKVGKAGPGLDDSSVKDTTVIDGKGHLLAPSFVDLYAQFCEPGHEEREDIASGSMAAAGGGYTAVCVRPDTSPVVDGADTARFVAERGARADKVDVLVLGALSRQLQGEAMAEIGEMAEYGVVAVTDGDRFVAKTGFLRHAMEYALNFRLPVLLTSEDPNLVDGAAHEGLVSLSKGLKSSPVAAEELAMARHIAMAELTGASTHLLKVTSAAGVRLVREAKTRGLPVTASVAIHNLVLDETSVADFDPMAKIWPPARSADDRKALLEALSDGTIDAIVSDHAPRSIEDKEVEFDLAVAGATSLDLVWALLNRLVLAGELPLPVAIRALSLGPRKILGLAGGSIAAGQPADLVLLDRSTQWEVSPASLLSRGKNTPFMGSVLSGRPEMTVRHGRIDFRRGNGAA
jgi:dihydroorotase